MYLKYFGYEHVDAFSLQKILNPYPDDRIIPVPFPLRRPSTFKINSMRAEEWNSISAIIIKEKNLS